MTEKGIRHSFWRRRVVRLGTVVVLLPLIVFFVFRAKLAFDILQLEKRVRANGEALTRTEAAESLPEISPNDTSRIYMDTRSRFGVDWNRICSEIPIIGVSINDSLPRMIECFSLAVRLTKLLDDYPMMLGQFTRSVEATVIYRGLVRAVGYHQFSECGMVKIELLLSELEHASGYSLSLANLRWVYNEAYSDPFGNTNGIQFNELRLPDSPLARNAALAILRMGGWMAVDGRFMLESIENAQFPIEFQPDELERARQVGQLINSRANRFPKSLFFPNYDLDLEGILTDFLRAKLFVGLT